MMILYTSPVSSGCSISCMQSQGVPSPIEDAWAYCVTHTQPWTVSGGVWIQTQFLPELIRSSLTPVEEPEED